jgi:lambda family phage portal protein
MLKDRNYKKPEIKLTIPDKIVNYFFPIKGAQRTRARAFSMIAGSYFGASRTRRQTSQWLTSGGDADADTILDLKELRNRSRDLERNAPIAVGAISSNLTNVVGTGLKLQSRIDRKYLKMTDEVGDEWEETTEREFRLWAESQECDAARTLPFAAIQELVFRQAIVNGDVFIVPKRQASANPYDLKLLVVEADRVCNENNTPDTDKLIQGIEKDINGAPVQYHICKRHPGASRYSKESFEWNKIPAFGKQTGLRNVIHLYRMMRPNQTRGIPYLAPVIEPLKQLDRYTEAELMASVVSAMFTVFVKTESGETSFDLTGMGVETGATSSDTDLKLGNGAVVGLAKGESIESANPMRPNSGFDPFVTAILEQIGTALELPYEIIIRHFAASYSASRAALLEAWRFFRVRRNWLAINFCQVVYEIWLYEAVASERISAPGFFNDPMIRKAYSGAQWPGDSPGYIDPAKDPESAKLRMELGISTLDEETTLITGGDMEKNIPRIRKERKLLAEIGLWQPVSAKQTSFPVEITNQKAEKKKKEKTLEEEVPEEEAVEDETA